MSVIFPTNLGTRQLVSFFDPLNPGTTFYNPLLNPSQMTRKTGSVRKYQKAINGTSVIQGQYEYPPSELGLTWGHMDESDFINLSAFTSIYPCVYIDNNDQGYLGAFCIDSAEQLAGFTRNVWSVKASFLVQAPYNGNSIVLPQLTPPTLTATPTTSGGYIPNGTSIYVWATVNTPWGESVVGAPVTCTSTANNSYFTITWTVPTSTWYRYTSLYWGTANNSTTATLLMQTLPAASGSFTIYGPYVAYTAVNPPTYGTAFTGRWNGSLWTPSS